MLRITMLRRTTDPKTGDHTLGEIHLDIAQEVLYANLQVKRGPDFVRACAVETHLDISQEPLHMEI